MERKKNTVAFLLFCAVLVHNASLQTASLSQNSEYIASSTQMINPYQHQNQNGPYCEGYFIPYGNIYTDTNNQIEISYSANKIQCYIRSVLP